MKTTTMKTNSPTRLGTGSRRVGLTATLALCTALALPAGAATISFTPTADNTILNAEFANTNLGANNPISSGTVSARDQRAFLRFDVSTLDGLYSSIDSITLRLHYFDDSSTGAGTATVTTNVHAITAANRPWAEGTATWNNQSTGTPWAGSAGLSTAGTDYDSTVLASSTIDLSNRPAAGTAFDFTFTGTSAALTGLIDSWMVDNVDNSRDNPGLLLRDPTPTYGSRNRFTVSSTEDADANLHPQLIVNYTVIPEPSAALIGGIGGLLLLRRRRR